MDEGPLRRKTMLIGERWLRRDTEEDDRSSQTDENHKEKFTPQNQESNRTGKNSGNEIGGKQIADDGMIGNSNKVVIANKVTNLIERKTCVIVKKRLNSGILVKIISMSL